MTSRGLIARRTLAGNILRGQSWNITRAETSPHLAIATAVIAGRESRVHPQHNSTETFMMNVAAAQISRNKISICSSRNCSYQSSSERRVSVGERMLFEKYLCDATAVIFPFMIFAMLRAHIRLSVCVCVFDCSLSKSEKQSERGIIFYADQTQAVITIYVMC